MPPCLPRAMSVSSLSPTTAVRDGCSWYLCNRYGNNQLPPLPTLTCRTVCKVHTLSQWVTGAVEQRVGRGGGGGRRRREAGLEDVYPVVGKGVD